MIRKCGPLEISILSILFESIATPLWSFCPYFIACVFLYETIIKIVGCTLQCNTSVYPRSLVNFYIATQCKKNGQDFLDIQYGYTI